MEGDVKMKLTTKILKKIILQEMADMGIGKPTSDLTFERINELSRFVGYAVKNGKHWMFPQGIEHSTAAALNSLFVDEIGREGTDSLEAMQRYVDMVKEIPGADIVSIDEIL